MAQNSYSSQLTQWDGSSTGRFQRSTEPRGFPDTPQPAAPSADLGFVNMRSMNMDILDDRASTPTPANPRYYPVPTPAPADDVYHHNPLHWTGLPAPYSMVPEGKKDILAWLGRMFPTEGYEDAERQLRITTFRCICNHAVMQHWLLSSNEEQLMLPTFKLIMHEVMRRASEHNIDMRGKTFPSTSGLR